MSSSAQQTVSETSIPQDLASILGPISAESFLQKDYGKRFVYVAGKPGKFAGLLPWSVLNDILEQHRLEPPRLRLTREGKPVPSDKYVSFQLNRRRTGQPIPRINSRSLTRELQEGATLVLDNVDELHRPIRRLAESLERTFRVRVQVNSYSGWRTSHGFDLHWDDHDVFVLQVAGRKQWKVYGMTRPYPLGRDIERSVEPPSEVLWDGLLQDGDLLYIPRGWWHVATPLDEPTLHLTVGVNNPTGADLFLWFSERLRAAEIVRQDLPHLHGTEGLREHAARLRDAFLTAWRPEMVEEYMNYLDATSRSRPHFNLPNSATPEMMPAEGWTIRWAPARHSRIEDDGKDAISVVAFGRRWKFAAAARPILERLVAGAECSPTDLESAAGSTLSRKVIQEFVRELFSNGLVVVL